MKKIIPLILIISLLLVSNKNILSQKLTADFTADTTIGCVPLVVDFINLSTNNQNISYFWNFGNNTTSEKRNPSTIYIQPGLYTVSLTVTDGVNTETITKENFIDIKRNPIPDFYIDGQTQGCIPFFTKFKDNSTCFNDSIIQWYWDFGNGTFSQQPNPTAIYSQTGSYDVSLYIKDNFGCNASLLKTNFVNANKPTANFTADNTFSCSENITVYFENLSEGNDISEFLWQFGDGATSNVQNPTHTYSNGGDYDVTLIVTDILDCSDTITKENFISNQKTIADFSYNEYGACLNDSIPLINNSINANSYYWNFGNGNTSNNKNPTVVYSNPGLYEIKLISSNNFGCCDTIIKNIEIKDVNAYFEVDKYHSCQIPDTFYYNNLSTNAVEYVWIFGNDNYCFEENPQNIITEKGVYTDVLYAISENGCVDKYVAQDSITLMPPIAFFTPNNLINPYDIMGCVPLTVNFQDQSLYNVKYDSITNWTWNFGDGTFSTQQNPTHTFNKLDTFPVSLNISTALGCKAQSLAFAYTGTKQFANFTAQVEDTICASEAVKFTSLSFDENLINAYRWDFSDSTLKTGKDPKVFFKDTGYIDVKLTVYNNGCPDDTVVDNYVYVKGTFFDFQKNINCQNPYIAHFNADIINSTSFYWNFGDGSDIDSININPTHTYSKTGTYTVSLYAQNVNSGCDFYCSKNVKIKELNANYNADKLNICPNSKITFNSASSENYNHFIHNDSVCYFLWDFDDGTPLVPTTDTIIKHIFSNQGFYNVKLIVKNDINCADTITKVITVSKPNPNITAQFDNTCTPVNVRFNDSTYSVFEKTDFLWGFGDNNTSTQQNPEHTYSKNGSYSVNLTVTDEYGCVGSKNFDNFIQIHKPKPDFSSNKQNICTNEQINFNFNPQTAQIVEILWNFGDGTTSNIQSPNHSYSNPGDYNVSLTLVNSNDCDSTITKKDYINVQTSPMPQFSADTLSSNCYPLTVKFSDQTNYSNHYSTIWHFSNTASSSAKNPTYTYLSPGQYDVSLTTTSSNGCSQTIKKNNFISISGPTGNMIVPDTVCIKSKNEFKVTNLNDVFDVEWFMGEGSSFKDSIVNFTYNKSKIFYPVVLLRSDSINSCNKFFYDSLFVRDINAGFIIDNGNNGCVPFDINVTDTTKNTYTRTWYFGNGTQSNNYNAYCIYDTPGIYKLTLLETDKFGCKDTVKENIEVFPLPEIKIIKDTLVCSGNELKLWANGAQKYNWYPDYKLDNINSKSPTTNTDINITYNVEATDSNGCVNHNSVFIECIPEPKFKIYDTSIIIGDTLEMSNFAENIKYYYWSPDYYISSDTLPTVNLSPQQTTTYWLTIVDTADCFELTKAFTIDVLLKYSIDVPSAFSPNGDGINDKIYVKGWGIKELLYFKIYNRFGELVFSTNNINKGWDGRYKGKLQPVETYRYVAAVLSFDEKIRQKKGTIKLLH